MTSPRAYYRHRRFLWLCLEMFLLSLVFSEVTAITDAELDIPLNTLHEKYGSNKILDKLRTSHRPPLYHSADTGIANLDTVREELHLVLVEKVPNFTAGPIGVLKWYSVQNGPIVYAVGFSKTSLALITARPPSPGSELAYSFTNISIDTPDTVVAAATFKIFHPENGTTDAYAVVVTGEVSSSLTWYRITENSLEEVWTLQIKESVRNVVVTEVTSDNSVLILTKCTTTSKSAHCSPSVDIYQFHPQAITDIKLSQSISIGAEAGPISVGKLRDEVLLAIPVPDLSKVFLYRHVWPALEPAEAGAREGIDKIDYFLYGYFKNHTIVDSEGVNQAVFFEQNHQTWLAVAGLSRALYKIGSDLELIGCPKALKNLEKVVTWTPIPIFTYRKDVLIFAQCESKVSENTKHSVAALSWRSGKDNFALQFDHYCSTSYDKPPQRGSLSCLLEIAGPDGLSGTATLPVGGTSVILLVPNALGSSSLVRVFTSLLKSADPVVAKVDELNDVRSALEIHISGQERVIQELEGTVQDVLQVDGDNIITGNWDIDEVKSALAEVEDTASIIKEPYLSGRAASSSDNWSPADLEVNVEGLRAQFKELEDLVEYISTLFVDIIVPDDDGLIKIEGLLTVLGGLKVEYDSIFHDLAVTELNGGSISAIYEDAVRLNNLREIKGHKSLPALYVDNVVFSTINTVPADMLIFDSGNDADEPLVINGSLHFNHALTVDEFILPEGGTVNGLDISRSFLLPNQNTIPGYFDFEKVLVPNVTADRVNGFVLNPATYHAWTTLGVDQSSLNADVLDSVQVDGDVLFESVNGHYWGDLIKDIVWTDRPSQIPGTSRISKVIGYAGAEIAYLNGLPFPEEYALRSRPEQYITAEKQFHGGIYAGTVDCSGMVNDVKLDSVITLHSNQSLGGTLTLSIAYVGSDVEVKNKLNGVNINAIATPSPALEEGGVISANVYFTDLVVDGLIVVGHTLGDSSFSDILSDIVISPPADSTDANEPIIITGEKYLPSLSINAGLTVTSGLINNLPIDGFVTINTPQVFKNHITANKIEFGNINVTGLWHGVNVPALKRDVMTLYGNQKTTSSLIFESDSVLWASGLHIEELNDGLTGESVSVSQRPDVEYDVTLSENGEAIVDGSLTAKEITVDGNVIVKGKVCGEYLKAFEEHRLSLSKPQTFSGNIKIDHLEIRHHLNVSSVNNVPTMNLQQTYYPRPTDIEAGGFTVDELRVDGDIRTIYGVNGQRFDRIAADAIKLDENNDIEGRLIFKEQVSFGMLEVHNRVNDLSLELIANEAIMKDEDVVLKGEKAFDSGFAVLGDLNTHRLRGLDPVNVLTRTENHVVQGWLRVSRNVIASKDVAIDGFINGEEIKKISGRYKYIGKDRHQIIGNLTMIGQVSANDLFVHGLVNGRNLGDFFSSIVYKDKGGVISGDMTFVGVVIFLKPVSVDGTVNNIDLSEFAKNLVLSNGNYTEIESRVVFKETLSANGEFTVAGGVEASTFYGCNVTDWFTDAVLTNEEAHLYGIRHFDDAVLSSLTTSVLNSVDMSKLILLNTDQIIEANLNFAEITAHRMINVQGFINDLKLADAYRDTLMITEEPQDITASKIFTGPVRVEENLYVRGSINGLEVSKAATLDTDQIIRSPLYFQSNVKALSNVIVNELISGINLTEWSRRVLLLDSSVVQNVDASWNVLGNVTFMENVDGSGLLNGIDVNILEAMKQDVHNQIIALRGNLTAEWHDLCSEVQLIAEAAQKQPFLLDTIDVVQAINAPRGITSIHIFEDSPKRFFMFVSYSYSCSGALYLWNPQMTQWVLLDGEVANAGGISRWLTVPSKTGTYLVTSADYNRLNCSNYSGRVWRFDRKLEHKEDIPRWSAGQVNPAKSEFYTVSKGDVTAWRLQDGDVKNMRSWNLTSPGSSYLMARSSEGGVLLKDGSEVRSLEGTALSTDSPNNSIASILASVNNMNHFAVFDMSDGRRLAAVFEENSRSLTIQNVNLQTTIGRINAKNVRWITPLELGDSMHRGQTHIAFVEDHNTLRIVQYKGEQGFVDVANIALPVRVHSMAAQKLPARGLLRDRFYLVVRGETRVLMLEVEMLGDPLPDEPPRCAKEINF